jgi:hypothetical protein
MFNEEGDTFIVPVWEDGVWTEREFVTRRDFIDFLLPLFKQPGEYDFDETSFKFNEQARLFKENGKIYTMHQYKSKDWRKYWDDQKFKCRHGAIFINGDNTWYLPREYYMWINFMPIYDKVKKDFDFPEVRDGQYHMALYEILAELHWSHGSILKKRQMASSYYHMAKMLNLIWFENGPICKLGASLKDYIGLEGSWKFLEEYRSFLNDKTAWYRPMNPGKVFTWQQQIETKDQNGRKKNTGGKGMLQGMSFEKSDTKGVGGPCTLFFYEEAGIAPRMDYTFEYIRPAMQAGDITTGIFIAAGSVGDLSQCEPLKKMTMMPDGHSIYPVEHNLMDENNSWGRTGLFIPEQWMMPPCIDEYGNSLVEEALKRISVIRKKWKETLDPEKYRLRISQHPINIKEAFDYREESQFPLLLVGAQKQRIQDKEYPYEHIELIRQGDGEILPERSKKLPITEFPVDKKRLDKSGVIVCYERPDPNAQWGTYYGSIDPVAEGKTTTSESLCSIFIYKNAVEVTKINKEGISENFVEPEGIVCSWCGRYDDINETHKRLELIIEWYKAWTLVENNVSLFIQHMIERNKQKWLVPKSQIVFLKEAGSNKTVYSDFGWKNTGTLFKNHLLSYLIEWLKEVIDTETDADGTVISKRHGIERLPDVMALVEMEHYQPGVNVDRLVSLAALIAFVKVQQANRGYAKRVDRAPESLEKSNDLFKLNSSPFRHIGGSRGRSSNRPPRSIVKNRRR